MTRLSLSLAHRLIARPDVWHLALLWSRLARRRAEQIALPGVPR